MKITVKTEKSLRALNENVFNDIFTESIEGINNIKQIDSIEVNKKSIYFPAEDTDGEKALKEIMSYIVLESLEQNLYEVKLSLVLKENFYDEKENLLNAEVYVNKDNEIETKFYYEVGNFLKSKEEKRKYTTVYSAH